MRNHSVVSEFILLGLSADPQIQALLFVLLFVIYILTLMGNLMLLLVIRVDSQLHNPMYFFLGQLSFLDLCHSSVTVPKLLENLLSEKKTISVEGCMAQAFFVFATGGTESCLLAVMACDRCVAISSPLLYGQMMNRKLFPKMLENVLSESKTISVDSCLAQAFFVFATRGTEACRLAVMAYDRYVAISSPLLCGQVMNNQLCTGLVWGSWGPAFVDALINILLAVNLDYCEDQTLPHFSCELSSIFLALIPPPVSHSCSALLSCISLEPSL
ncbi:hypothetical protein EI555_016207 [Monodon monoceros]|uniref:G-protein coupled receptors family 1 profile domain-containing protein n=1 Tax=Monodon monoceros TaxID=40151 RepID=A0A4U1ESY0_MONMO|nr:hypothetical protein EI555_016207 [Monodon monoceros]